MVSHTDLFYIIDDLCKIIISCLFKNIKIIQKKIYNVGYPGKKLCILQIANMVRKFLNVLS